MQFVIVYLLPKFNLTDLTLNVFFLLVLVCSLWDINFCVLIFDRILFFMSSCFFLTTSDFHGSLHLALDLFGMHSAAVSIWMVTTFSDSTFWIHVSDIPWIVTNLFLAVTVYLLLIFLLISENTSHNVCFLFLHRLWHTWGSVSNHNSACFTTECWFGQLSKFYMVLQTGFKPVREYPIDFWITPSI